MTTTLEDRLAALGEQLDRLIEDAGQRVMHDVALEAAGPTRRWPRWTVAVAAVAACALAAGVWAAVSSPHRTTTVPATDPTGPMTTQSPSTDPLGTDADPATTVVPSPVSLPVPSSSEAAAAMPPPLAIGTSVMLGAAEPLEAAGFRVVTGEGAQAPDQIEMLRELLAAGEVGDIVVIESGVNGTVTTDQYEQMATLLADVPTVVFLTAHFDGATWVEPNNERAWELPRRHANVSILDWDGLADFGNIPGMAVDGVHLGTDAARQAYANFVFDAVGHREWAQVLPGFATFDQLRDLLPQLGSTGTPIDPLAGMPSVQLEDTTFTGALEGSAPCLRSQQGISGASTCASDGDRRGVVGLMVGDTTVDIALLHRDDVRITGDGACPIVRSEAVNGLVISACRLRATRAVAFLTVELPDGSLLLTSPSVGTSTGLSPRTWPGSAALDPLGRRLPSLATVEGAPAPTPFLTGSAVVESFGGRPCVTYGPSGTTLRACPIDGQRTGLVSIVAEDGVTGAATLVMLHDASVIFEGDEACAIDRAEIAGTTLVVSGCEVAAGVGSIELTVAHDGRAEVVVVPVTSP